MTKEDLIKEADVKLNMYAEQENEAFEGVIAHLRDLADDMDNAGYLNEHKLNKILAKIEEYKHLKQLTHENVLVYNALKLIDE